MESGRSSLAVSGWQWLKNGLFPINCFNCQIEGWKFCPTCSESYVAALAETVCPFCHVADSEGKTCLTCATKTYLDGNLALGLYHDKVLRGFLQNWKFNSDQDSGAVLLDWLSKFPLSQMLPPVDWYVTAVPLHERRQRERGFNQAEVLARAAAKEIETEYFELLCRREWTDPQAKRAAEERCVGELDEVFETIGIVPPCVLLCDDVLTSGSTMDAAAKVLKEAGAGIVWGFTLLRADG